VRVRIVLVTAIVAALFAAVPAAAQNPTDAQYDDSVTQVTEAAGGGPPPPVSGGALPFTGADAVALAALALALFATGIALRRTAAAADRE
jgi:hypothetical protein